MKKRLEKAHFNSRSEIFVPDAVGEKSVVEKSSGKKSSASNDVEATTQEKETSEMAPRTAVIAETSETVIIEGVQDDDDEEEDEIDDVEEIEEIDDVEPDDQVSFFNFTNYNLNFIRVLYECGRKTKTSLRIVLLNTFAVLSKSHTVPLAGLALVCIIKYKLV